MDKDERKEELIIIRQELIRMREAREKCSKSKPRTAIPLYQLAATLKAIGYTDDEIIEEITATRMMFGKLKKPPVKREKQNFVRKREAEIKNKQLNQIVDLLKAEGKDQDIVETLARIKNF